MENFVLPSKPFVVYICAVRSYQDSAQKILRIRLNKGNGHLGKLVLEIARLVNDGENGC